MTSLDWCPLIRASVSRAAMLAAYDAMTTRANVRKAPAKSCPAAERGLGGRFVGGGGGGGMRVRAEKAFQRLSRMETRRIGGSTSLSELG